MAFGSGLLGLFYHPTLVGKAQAVLRLLRAS